MKRIWSFEIKLLFFIFLFQFSNLILAQKTKIGIMPIHVKIIKSESPLFAISGFGSNIEKYEERYYPIFESVLLDELKKALNLKQVKQLYHDELEEEERLKEDSLFSAVVSQDRFNKNLSRKTKKWIALSELPFLANHFSHKLNSDYLIYITFFGYHVRTERQEKKDKPLPDKMYGNITSEIFVVNGKTGEIIKSNLVVLRMFPIIKKPIESIISDIMIEQLAKRVAKKIAKCYIKI